MSRAGEYRGELARWCSVIPRATALAVLIVFSSTADARRVRPAADVITKSGEVTINWSRGMLITSAGASADLRAPTANIARVKASRNASDLAIERLADAAAALPFVSETGGSKTVGEAIDPAADRRLELLSKEAVTLATIYGSDGSTTVTVGLPIEAVRRLAAGPTAPPEKPTAAKAGTKRAAVAEVTVDARAVTIVPSVGLVLTAGSESYRGPVLYRRASAAAGTTAKLAATSAKAGALILPEDARSAVASARAASAVVIVLVK